MTSENVTRYVRYRSGDQISHGILEGDTIRQLNADLFSNPQPTGNSVRRADVKLLTPLDPWRVSKVIGIAGNFDRPDTPKRVIPHPRMFAKYAINLVADGDDVEVPPDVETLDHEGELVVVIGKPARFISQSEVKDYILGVAVGNDVSYEAWYGERNGPAEPSRLISKAADTWSPLGNEIVAGLDYSDLMITVTLDGELAASGRTSQMTNGVDYVISYLSQYMTLWPGDLVYMGTPPWLPGMRQMRAGQTLHIEIEKIGTLTNKIVPQKGGIANPWWPAEVEKLPPPAETPAQPVAPTQSR